MSNSSFIQTDTTVVVPTDTQFQAYGRLSYLSAYCPLHRTFSPALLKSLFLPAVTHDCVRFFANENGAHAAALIWARLSDQAAEKMIYDSKPPVFEDWASGNNLWFLDIIAPFGHGKQIIRHLARNPPEGPFYFGRVGPDGKIRKVVEGDKNRGRRGMVHSYTISRDAA